MNINISEHNQTIYSNILSGEEAQHTVGSEMYATPCKMAFQYHYANFILRFCGCDMSVHMTKYR